MKVKTETLVELSNEDLREALAMYIRQKTGKLAGDFRFGPYGTSFENPGPSNIFDTLRIVAVLTEVPNLEQQ